MSLTAAVWPQFATQVFRGGIGRLTCIGAFGGYVNKQVTTFTFRAQATTCSNHHTRTVMDAGCECAHEYGRLTSATAGLLFQSQKISYFIRPPLCSLYCSGRSVLEAKPKC